MSSLSEEPEAVTRRVADVARRLREMREAAGLSQRAFARLVGIRQSVICEYETGRHVPNLATLIRLLEAAGVDDFRI